VTPPRSSFKTRLMAGTMGLVLLCALGWAWSRLSTSRESAAVAAQDLADCNALVKRIESLRRQPTVADSREIAQADLSSRIDDAARAAGCPDAVGQILPDPPRRIGETNYLEVPTQVRLKAPVSLEEMFTFLHDLSGGGVTVSPRLRLRTIRLGAPRTEDADEKWLVESTLTYIIFSPRGKTDSAPARSDAVAVRQPGL
jgi:hypothetical protein